MNFLSKEIIKGLLPEEEENYSKVVGVYGGGFKPPTSGHFEVVKTALKENPEIDEFIVFIGKKERDGVTQDQSLLIWETYNKYLPSKVKFVPSSVAPIKDIYNYAKNNPDHKVLWVLGAREGNEEDFKDLSSRTTSINKYPNIDLRTIVTKGGVSGTAARNAAEVSLEKLIPFLPKELDDEELQEVYNILSLKLHESVFTGGIASNATLGDLVDLHKISLRDLLYQLELGTQKELEHTDSIDNAFKIAMDHLYEDPQYYTKLGKVGLEEILKEQIQNIENELSGHLQSLTKHFKENGIELKPYPKVQYITDDENNAKGVLGKTAHYDPNSNTIVLYTFNRHPKDILRSYAHELIHVYQNAEDRLNQMSHTTDINTDKYLEKIEGEAYLKGNLLFRSWTDKQTGNKLNENKFQNLVDKYKEVIDLHDWEIALEPISRDQVQFADDVPSTERYYVGVSRDEKTKKAIIYYDRDLTDEDVLHELLHLKLPDFSEDDINALTDKILGKSSFPHLKVTEKEDPFGLTAYARELSLLREDEEGSWKIYLDMDGVLADFNKRFHDIAGMSPDDFEDKYGKDRFWELIDKDNKIKFWVGIPVMDGAEQLVNFAKDYNYEILTSPSREEVSRLGKRLWVKKHTGSLFPSKPIINFKFAKYKQEVKPQLSKYDILVDDRKKTIDAWNQAGGTGVYYKSASQSIKQLKQIVA